MTCVDLLSGGHVDAARRLVEDEELRLRREPFADDNLLLIPTTQEPMSFIGSRGFASRRHP
jgi:hypothetical protein